MRKISKKTMGLLLVIILCFSMMPMSAMATGNESTPEVTEQPGEPTGAEPTEEAKPTPEPSAEPSPAPSPEATPTTAAESIEFQNDEDSSESSIESQPELVETVGAPLAKVTYHYYDEGQNLEIVSFTDYAVESSHSYNAFALANGGNITISANKYPGKVPVSTGALRFRVLLNGSEDITAQAAYDAATGIVSLPAEYEGRSININWYCPESEIVDIPVNVTVGVFDGAQSEITEHSLTLASNANAIDIPLSGVDRIVVNQNGLDLFENEYSLDNGTLTVSTSALGGDLIVSAFPVKNGGGFTTMGTSATTVNHERQHYNSVNYGYVTSYYVANGNVAYCLDPSVSGVNSGQYSVSGYMERGTGRDNLIKAAWYLFRCPGEDSSLFADLDWEHAYGYSHVAASYIYLEIAGDDLNKAWEGIESNTAARDRIMSIVNAVKAKPMPPSGFDCYLYNVGNLTSQSLMGWDYTPTGSLEIQKVSSDPDKTDGNSCYSLQGAVFGVYNGSNVKLGTITTDKDGKGKLENIEAGQTGLYILEEKPPTGYAENTTKIPFEIASGQTTTKVIKNNPQGDPVTILLQKLDADLLTDEEAQGMASLANAQFTIRYYKGNYTEDELKGKTPARTWIVKTDEDGFTMLHPDFLLPGSDPLYYASNGTTPTIPLGTVSMQETKAPAGYLINDTLYVRYSKAGGLKEAVNTYNAPIVPDKIIRGGVSTQKWDFELNRPEQPQGDGDLAATLDIYNRSRGSVVVNGKKYAPNTIVYTMVTDAATGAATTTADLLPYGDYEIVERDGNQPTGYLNTGKTSQKFNIRENGVIVNLKTDAGAVKNNPIRGSFYLEKWDNEINRNEAQGSGTLDSTVEITNASKHLVLVDGVEYQPGDVIMEVTLSEDGRYQCPDRYLPYGSYLWRETKPPTHGYLHTGVLNGSFVIRTDGEIVKLNTSETAARNDPIRADLRGVKIGDGDGKRLAGVPFSITSVTTGESHTVVTDRNGQFDTSSDWNPHSQNTNAGLTDRDGIWFGELWTLDDSKGALLYDTYLLEEQPCEANADRELLSFEVSVYRHNVTIDLGTLTNDYIQKPEIFTTAMDSETMLNTAFVSETTTILDTLYYSGLKVGKEYTAKGVLMDQQTGEPLIVDGQEVRAEKTFKALSETGSITMEFTFDSLALKGKSVVVFEEIYLGDADKPAAVHQEIDDPGQTIQFFDPKIGTEATGSEGAKDLIMHPETTIIDTVVFENLVVSDKPYRMVGILMDQATGEPLLVDDKEVTAEYSFIAKKESGTLQMEFVFDSSALKGRSVVVFERLYYGENLITEHCSIDDPGQTVKFLEPSIRTLAASDTGEKDLIIHPETKIIDMVEFENLFVSEKPYRMVGILMDQSTGQLLLVDGKEVTAEYSFTALKESGSVTMEFVLNSMDLAGKTVVVYEELYYDTALISEHKAIDDPGQSVKFLTPGIRTSARGEDGTKVIPVSGTAKVIDTISYENLPVGEEFEVSGVLMNRETGKPATVDGKEITASAKFVPTKPSGTVDVEFVFDSTGLQDTILVVFETLVHVETEKEICEHKDLTDDAQTVGVGIEVLTDEPEPTTSGGGAKTGGSFPVWLLIVAIVSAAAAVLLISRKKAKVQK